MSDDLELNEDVVAEDGRELREGSPEAGAELERLETLERHQMLTHAADRNALEAHREKYGEKKDEEEEADEDASD